MVYQVYPRSFADSNGDGVGDLPGATGHLSHLSDLGVDAVWLSPFYTSPQADAGYDVADYRDVDPRLGTLADFDLLMARATELGLRVIVDLVPNHCSDEHPWFEAALAAGPGSPERARFHFRDGRGPAGSLPPNNWMSVFGGPAWTRVVGPDGPEQWYLHLFDSKQPDWDWTNPGVQAEFESVLRFWLDKGVAGFRVDVAHGLVKKAGLPDHPGEQHALAGVSAERDETAEPLPTNSSPYWDQDGVHEIYRSWRAVLDSYAGPQRILCAEAWVTPTERMARYLRPDEMHQAFAFDFLESHWDATQLRDAITRDIAALAPVGASCTWVLSNHDVVRHASRLGLDQTLPRPHGITAEDPQPDRALGLRRARAATMAMLALPGAAYLYQGEELGLPEHTALPAEVRQDPAFHRTSGLETGRDGCRVPLPWAAAAPGFGFSPTGASWLPQPKDWAEYAVDAQLGVPESTLELYRLLLALRHAHRLGAGTLDWDNSYDPATVIAWRIAGVHVLVNLGADPVTVPSGYRVVACSGELTADGQVPLDTAVWSIAD